MDERWYAVQTKPRCEDQAMFWLARRSQAETFLPKLQAIRRRGSAKVPHIEPLFPSYLFVRMIARPEEWQRVRWTPGVRAILTSGGIPVPVADAAIELLQMRAEGGLLRLDPQIRTGARVRITHGPLTGLVGILERPTSRAARVRVLLQLMNTAAAVEVDVIDLEELESPRAG